MIAACIGALSTTVMAQQSTPAPAKAQSSPKPAKQTEQEHEAQILKKKFTLHKADAIKRLSERADDTQKRLTCVKAATDIQSLNTCLLTAYVDSNADNSSGQK